MRDTYKMKYQANQFYYGEYLDDEGEPIPYDLDHITSEDLFEDYIEDVGDDDYLWLKENAQKLYYREPFKPSQE